MQTVLNYGQRSVHDHDRSDRVYLILPCAAWRIVAPLPSDRRINIFQKAVLGLCRTGSYPISEIASRLKLHPRLIDTIARELAGAGWVDPTTWRPTTNGLAMLDEEDSSLDSLVTGWVFQDPRSGELWPYFSRQLELQNTEPHPEATRLFLLLGSVEKPRKIPAWQLAPQKSPARPSSEAILQAIRRFRRRDKLKGFMRLATSGFDEPLSGGSPEMVSRITFISDQPESMGMVTYGYLPYGGGLPPQVCDPFGFGCPEEMWRQLSRAAQTDEGAARAQRKLLDFANAQDAPALEEQLKCQKQAAENYLIERLSLDIRSFSGVFEHLVGTQHNLALAIAMGTNPQGQLAPAIGSCRKTLEALLKEVARQSPLTNAYQLLTGDHKLDLTTVQNSAGSLGFNCPIPNKLRDSIQGQGSTNETKKRVQAIGKDLKHIYSLTAAIVGTILAASSDKNHPFRQAAKRTPDLLSKLIQIIELGNPASHDESHNLKRVSLTVSDATELRELTLEVTASVLNLPFRKG